jgi:hypothetical protein
LRLLGGLDPYSARTYQGNPIDLLPGEILLAMPFVLILGNGAYQGLFWLSALFIAARWKLRSGVEALMLLWTLLIVSPVVLQQLVTGGDHVTNPIHVLVAMLLLGEATRRDEITRAPVVGALLLGVGLSSRVNFLLLLPLMMTRLWRRAGWRRALALGASIATVTVLVTLPFFLRDPVGFPALAQFEIARRYDLVHPVGAALMPPVAAVVAVALALARDTGDLSRWLGRCAITQAVPVCWLAALDSFHAGAPRFAYMGYGTFYLCFGALALWPRATGPVEAGPGPRAAWAPRP